MSTKIQDLKEEVRQLLRSFSALPDGWVPQAVFERPEAERRRSIREDADASYFRPEDGCYIRIKFVRAESVPPERVSAQAPRPSAVAIANGNERDAVRAGTAMYSVVRALERAEREPGKTFIAIKTFRDRILPQAGMAGEQASVALNGAIAEGLVLTGKIPNLNKPGLWTTTVRLNREDPRVRAILGAGEPGPARRFMPRDFGPVSASAEVIGARK